MAVMDSLFSEAFYVREQRMNSEELHYFIEYVKSFFDRLLLVYILCFVVIIGMIIVIVLVSETSRMRALEYRNRIINEASGQKVSKQEKTISKAKDEPTNDAKDSWKNKLQDLFTDQEV